MSEYQISGKETHRESRRLQFSQVTHSTTHNGSLDSKNLHARRHNPTRYGAVLITRLLNDDNRARLGRILRGKVACIVNPVLARREPVFFGVLRSD